MPVDAVFHCYALGNYSVTSYKSKAYTQIFFSKGAFLASFQVQILFGVLEKTMKLVGIRPVQSSDENGVEMEVLWVAISFWVLTSNSKLRSRTESS